MTYRLAATDLWSRYYLYVVGHDIVLCEVREDLSRNLNKIESVGLIKSYSASARSAI